MNNSVVSLKGLTEQQKSRFSIFFSTIIFCILFFYSQWFCFIKYIGGSFFFVQRHAGCCFFFRFKSHFSFEYLQFVRWLCMRLICCVANYSPTMILVTLQWQFCHNNEHDEIQWLSLLLFFTHFEMVGFVSFFFLLQYFLRLSSYL